MSASVSTLVRLDDWPGALFAFIAARRDQPFAWGSQDCCLFAADAVAAITGTDLAAGLRGYTTALGAARRARSAGATREDPYGVALWPALAFLSEVSTALAGRGDVVLMGPSPEAPARELCLGICLGLHAAVPGPDGLIFRPRAFWRRAWRVG